MDNEMNFETIRENFAYYDRTGMQAFFEQKALEGWQLCKREVFSDWKFKRIEPKKLHYAITYLPQFPNEDSFLLSENKNEYLELCAEQGWQFVCTHKNMVIFLSEEENPLPLETDPEVELNTIHKAMKRYSIPRIILSFFGMTIMFAIMLLNYYNNPIDFFLGLSSRVYLLMLVVALFIGYSLSEFVGYLLWRKKALAAAVTGKFSKTSFSGMINIICVVVICISSVFMLVIQSVICNDKSVFGFFAVLVAYVIISHFIEKFKEKRKSGWKKRALKAVEVIVGIAMMLGVSLIGEYSKDDKDYVETYPSGYGDYELPVYKDDIPLKLEDLGFSVNSKQYSYYLDTEKSVFITRTQVTQTVRLDVENYSSMPEIEYNIYEIKTQFLYDRCLVALLDDSAENNHSYEEVCYKEMNASAWAADKAYQLYCEEITEGKYLLSYDNKIIELTADFVLAEEQMRFAGEVFGNMSE